MLLRRTPVGYSALVDSKRDSVDLSGLQVATFGELHARISRVESMPTGAVRALTFIVLSAMSDLPCGVPRSPATLRALDLAAQALAAAGDPLAAVLAAARARLATRRIYW